VELDAGSTFCLGWFVVKKPLLNLLFFEKIECDDKERKKTTKCLKQTKGAKILLVKKISRLIKHSILKSSYI